MKCPQCGHDIPDGLLLCENCGAEINIVPDFDIEIENSINETLSTIVAQINPEEKRKKEKEETLAAIPKDESSSKTSNPMSLEEDFFEDRFAIMKNRLGKKGLSLLLLLTVIVIAVIVLISLFLYRKYSVDYQIRQAKNLISEENYSDAENFLDKAISLSDGDIDNVILVSDCFIKMGNISKGTGLIKDIILKKDNDYSEKIKLFDKLISILSENSEYNTINRILIECDDIEIQNHYNEYMAYMPVFKIPTGNYQTEIDLEIETNTEGTVRYTLDGAEPSENNGNIYSGPIHIGAGEVSVKAVFINSFGAVSDVANAYYLIDSSIPDAPSVTPESGSYDDKIMVTVDLESLPEGTTVYYTDDGKDPNTEISPIYEKPIELKQGHFNFSFILVSPEGRVSPVTRRSYSVELKSNVTVDMAKAAVLSALIEQKIVLDTEGTAPQNAGKYSFEYNSIIEISGFGYYYRLDEFIEDNTGIKKQTGLLYAVSLDTGIPYRLLVNPDNTWGLIPLKP